VLRADGGRCPRANIGITIPQNCLTCCRNERAPTAVVHGARGEGLALHRSTWQQNALPAEVALAPASTRAVIVHPAAMLEALRKLYDAAPLAEEIEGRK